MSNKVIEVKNVVKKFGDIEVLKNVSVNFEKGKIYGLVGRNGSGKTILLKCICGFILPTSGEILVNDKHVGKDIDIPDNIGAIIENPGFLPNYSAYMNLNFLAMIRNKVGKDEIKNILNTVGLDSESKKNVGKFSLGMKQRLGIAQALMENPDILILDEPMNGLDNSGVREVRKILLDFAKKNKTVIIASHNLEDINLLCEDIYEMDGGVLSKLDNISELMYK